MATKEKAFILAGNGPYDNRGCEAIIRGTTEIIRAHFDTPQFLAISNFQDESQLKGQSAGEYDKAIIHVKICPVQPRFSPGWFLQTALRFLGSNSQSRLIYRNMIPYLKESECVLSVGGDNYSLDYGTPDLFTMLDDLVLAYKKPLIIWGASVGPFFSMPDYEKYMVSHLKRLTAIFVRETASLEYLEGCGIKENVHLMADPAFCLKPSRPVLGIKIEDGAIGINLSPLMARYVTDGDYKKWVILSAEILREIYSINKRRIYLIPHVTSPHTNDYKFLEDVMTLLNKIDVFLIPNKYDAAQTKWIISKMEFFAGARTHSTIAAISSCVPTLSFGYSIKAQGINKDVFGHENYCVSREEYQPVSLAQKIKMMLSDSDVIREQLSIAVPRFIERAFLAGGKLRAICK